VQGRDAGVLTEGATLSASEGGRGSLVPLLCLSHAFLLPLPHPIATPITVS